MNCREFSVEFDILYNNISSGQAPGLNGYDKSVYLTLAQDELVKTNYSGYNPTREAVEETEKRRKQLSELMRTSVVASTKCITGNNAHNIVNDTGFKSYIFPLIPEDADAPIWYILYEDVVFKTTGNPCKVAGKTAWVMPTNHDDFTLSSINPFRKPNERKVWRLDYSSLTNFPTITPTSTRYKVSEIISAYDIEYYRFRYLKKPFPIILENINIIEVGLTIDGKTKPYGSANQTVDLVASSPTLECCELSEVFHRDILKRAVELAYRDYKENTLANMIQTNDRTE